MDTLKRFLKWVQYLTLFSNVRNDLLCLLQSIWCYFTLIFMEWSTCIAIEYGVKFYVPWAIQIRGSFDLWCFCKYCSENEEMREIMLYGLFLSQLQFSWLVPHHSETAAFSSIYLIFSFHVMSFINMQIITHHLNWDPQISGKNSILVLETIRRSIIIQRFQRSSSSTRKGPIVYAGVVWSHCFTHCLWVKHCEQVTDA